jgi:hypothetical protein
MNTEVGKRYRLTADHGNEPGASNPAFHPDGVQNADGTITSHPMPDGQPLRAGADATVVAIVPAEEEGAGGHEEECAVLNVNGRMVSFTDAQIADLFEEVF